MITRDSDIFGTKRIDNTLMKWCSELTLKGELITIENDDNKIMALVDGARYFGKVKLLQADCLNYKWAKEQALKVYESVSKARNNL